MSEREVARLPYLSGGGGRWLLSHHLFKERDFLGFGKGFEVGEKFDFSRVLVRPLSEEVRGGFGCFCGLVVCHGKRMLHFESEVKIYFNYFSLRGSRTL